MTERTCRYPVDAAKGQYGGIQLNSTVPCGDPIVEGPCRYAFGSQRTEDEPALLCSYDPAYPTHAPNAARSHAHDYDGLVCEQGHPVEVSSDGE